MVKKQTQVAEPEPQTKIEYAEYLYRQGHKVPEIADALDISPRTVRGYIYRVRNPDKYKEIVARYLAKRTASEPKAPVQEAKPQAPTATIPKWKAPSKRKPKQPVQADVKARAKKASKKAKAVVAEFKKAAKTK